MAIVINFVMTTAVKNMERESLKSIIALSAVESWWKMIKEALLDISKGYVKVFFDGNPVDSIYSVDGITDDEPGMKKIQLTFLVKEVLFKE
jgi:hypothetical protein